MSFSLSRSPSTSDREVAVKLTTERGYHGGQAETNLEHDELVCHIRTVRKERNEMRAALLACQSENASLRTALDQVEAKWRAIVAEKDERYDTDTAALKARISALEASLADCQDENAQLRETVAKIPTLQEQNDRLEAEVQRLQQQSERRKKEHAAALLASKKLLAQEQATAAERQRQAEEHTKILEETKTRLGNQITGLQDELAQEAEARAEDKKAHEEAQALLQAQVDAMQALLDAANEQVQRKTEELEATIQRHKQEMLEVNEKLQQQKDECIRLEAALAEARLQAEECLAQAQAAIAAKQWAEKALQALRGEFDTILQRQTPWQNYETYKGPR